MKFKKLIVACLILALSSFALVGCGDIDEIEEESIEEEPVEDELDMDEDELDMDELED